MTEGSDLASNGLRKAIASNLALPEGSRVNLALTSVAIAGGYKPWVAPENSRLIETDDALRSCVATDLEAACGEGKASLIAPPGGNGK